MYKFYVEGLQNLPEWVGEIITLVRHKNRYNKKYYNITRFLVQD